MGIKIRENLETLLPYPPGKPIEDVQREFNLENIVKLASNENPLGPSPKAVWAILDSVNEINLYPDGNVFYLRKALSEKLKIKPENLIFGNGSDELIILISQTYLDKDDEIIISDKAFIRYQMAAQVQNAKWISVPMIDYRHDLKGFVKAITPKTKAIFIDNPNNPIGTMVTKSEFEELINSVPENVLIVMDEAYYEYIDDPDYPKTLDYLDKHKNIIILRTFSKIYGLAGIRLGYGIADAEIITNIDRVRPPFNVSRLAQAAGLAAIDDKEHLERSRKTNKEGLKYIYGELEKLGLKYVKSYANFVLIDMNKDGVKVFDDLQRLGVIVRPVKGYKLPNHIRVTIGTPEENKIFIEALKKVI